MATSVIWEHRIEKIRNLTITGESDANESHRLDIARTEADLNGWCQDGWELVSIAPGGIEWVAVLRKRVTV